MPIQPPSALLRVVCIYVHKMQKPRCLSTMLRTNIRRLRKATRRQVERRIRRESSYSSR